MSLHQACVCVCVCVESGACVLLPSEGSSVSVYDSSFVFRGIGCVKRRIIPSSQQAPSVSLVVCMFLCVWKRVGDSGAGKGEGWVQMCVHMCTRCLHEPRSESSWVCRECVHRARLLEFKNCFLFIFCPHVQNCVCA